MSLIFEASTGKRETKVHVKCEFLDEFYKWAFAKGWLRINKDTKGRHGNLHTKFYFNNSQKLVYNYSAKYCQLDVSGSSDFGDFCRLSPSGSIFLINRKIFRFVEIGKGKVFTFPRVEPSILIFICRHYKAYAEKLLKKYSDIYEKEF